MNSQYKLEMLNSQIGNITEYLTSQYMSGTKRKQLEYKLDELCTKRDYLENTINNQVVNEHQVKDTTQSSINKVILIALIGYIVLSLYMIIKWS